MKKVMEVEGNKGHKRKPRVDTGINFEKHREMFSIRESMRQERQKKEKAAVLNWADKNMPVDHKEPEEKKEESRALQMLKEKTRQVEAVNRVSQL